MIAMSSLQAKTDLRCRRFEIYLSLLSSGLEFCCNGPGKMEKHMKKLLERIWKGKNMAKKINSKGGGTGRKQTFTISAPGALSVQLMGDFTQWQDHPINMEKGANGVWRTTVELPPGTHHYRFSVDGEWRNDPECTLRAPNPYGGENMIRQVRASGMA
jgi:1,4-alpha-glucan branching enzyme